jgi:hypothetical protein
MLRGILFGLVVSVLAGCAAAPPRQISPNVTEVRPGVLRYEGPELHAEVLTRTAQRELGSEWLVLEVSLRASDSSTSTVSREEITLTTPGGQRLPIISQEEFRRAFGELRGQLRTIELIPRQPTDPLEVSRRLADRWFLVEPFQAIAVDTIRLSGFEVHRGPLVFLVPGGVQPGRWVLRIELEESVATIPFILEPPR